MHGIERWLYFWFKPYQYLHSSWMGDLDQRLLTEQSTSLAWHLAYPYLCSVYRLPKEYRDMTEGLINQLVEDLLVGDKTPLDLACFMLSGASRADAVPTSVKRIILQRSRALSLKKRLYDPVINIQEEDCDLLLVYLLCMCVDADYWQRVRLLFDKDRVLLIENNSRDISFSDSNKKAIQRAWNEIYQLKRQFIEASDENDLECVLDESDGELSNPDDVDVALALAG